MLIIPFISNSQDSAKVDLEFPVIYNAEDSMIFDISSQIIYLYGNASVVYDKITLKADRIDFNFKDKEASAKFTLDSAGSKVGRPVFSDGGEEYMMDSVAYNFDTKKAIIYNARTEQAQGYLFGEIIKKQPNSHIHLEKGRYTTCSLENPHYYFKLSRAVVKPDDKIVSGPFNLWIADIPTPLGLPFGYFPNKKGGTNGIVIPTYGNSPNLGFFLQNGGYYLRISEQFDTQILGDIYSRGSWGLSNISNYKNKYKYSGRFNLSYSTIKNSEREFPDYSESKQFFVRWTHTQDAKANPGSRFSANVNIGSVNNFQNNFNSTGTDFLTNTFTSNISWSKSWVGKPFNLGVNLRHNQNTQTQIVNLTLPELNFNTNRIFPFKKLAPNAKSKLIRNFTQNTGFTYSGLGKQEISAPDSLYSLNDLSRLNSSMRNGVKHTINASSSLKAGPFSINPAFNLTERWYTQSYNETYSLSDSLLVKDTLKGFTRAYDHRLSVGASTKIYGMYGFAGFLRGKRETQIRHVLTPTLAFTYSPAFGNTDTIKDYNNEQISTFSPHQIGIFGQANSRESGLISLNLQNTLDMKYKPKKDSTGKFKPKKVGLIDNFSLRSSYNLMAEENHLSNIVMSARTKLFKDLNLVVSGNLDPYQYSDDGVKLPEFMVKESGKLGRIVSSTGSVRYRLQSKKRNQKKNEENVTDEQKKLIDVYSDQYIDFTVPWELGINYNINMSRYFINATDTSTYTQTVRFNANLSLTKKWKITIDSGYDFTNKDFTYTTIGIHRDMHCWEGQFNWVPFGPRQSYNLTISVKASVLSDLKLQRKRSWYDNTENF